MRCFVYKSLRRAETFVYLSERDAFGTLPEALRSGLGELAFVVEFELGPARRLAREDSAVVLRNLQDHGVHVQFPPTPGQLHGSD